MWMYQLLLCTLIFIALFTNAQKIDYQEVYGAIAELLDDDNYDDGSYGPVFIRLCWHASGTYDSRLGDGGSHRATMRFSSESAHGCNKGLDIARNRLEPLIKKFPGLSHGDLWTMAGVCAVQQMGGPLIPWKPGRIDGTAKDQTPDGRIPDGANTTYFHSRYIFGRQGLSDREAVALLGSHSLGRCHKERSGFEGPWTGSPTTLTNLFYKNLLNKKWVDRKTIDSKWTGPSQYATAEDKNIMMLPSDMAFLKDPDYTSFISMYASNSTLFKEDYGKAFRKLIEQGVPFKEGTVAITFKKS